MSKNDPSTVPPMHYDIHTYTSEYDDDLSRLYQQSRRYMGTFTDPEPFGPADFARITADEIIRVAISDGKPVGFIAWYAPDQFIHHLYVAPAYVGKGIGTALLQDCLTHIGRPARLKCLRANVNALGFYRVHGWVVEMQGESPEGDYYLLQLT